mgnify:CR=1 FL=1
MMEITEMIVSVISKKMLFLYLENYKNNFKSERELLLDFNDKVLNNTE